MKTIAAMLMGLLLVLGQNVFVAGAAAAPAKAHCACSNCKVMACCAKSQTPDSGPAAPVPNAPQARSQSAMAATLVAALSVPSASAEFISPSVPLTAKVPATPLYRRNCSFLI